MSNVKLNHKLNELEEIRLPVALKREDLYEVENWNNKFTQDQLNFVLDTVIDGFKNDTLTDVANHIMKTMEERFGFKYVLSIRPCGVMQLTRTSAVKMTHFKFKNGVLDYIVCLAL